MVSPPQNCRSTTKAVFLVFVRVDMCLLPSLYLFSYLQYKLIRPIKELLCGLGLSVSAFEFASPPRRAAGGADLAEAVPKAGRIHQGQRRQARAMVTNSEATQALDHLGLSHKEDTATSTPRS